MHFPGDNEASYDTALLRHSTATTQYCYDTALLRHSTATDIVHCTVTRDSQRVLSHLVTLPASSAVVKNISVMLADWHKSVQNFCHEKNTAKSNAKIPAGQQQW